MLCDPMNYSMPGLPVHHQLQEFTQTHAHRIGDAIQPSHPLSSPSPAPNPSQHQGLLVDTCLIKSIRGHSIYFKCNCQDQVHFSKSYKIFDAIFFLI